MMTQAEFAQKIKAKYPQYNSLPDQELTSKMIEKYPMYKNQVSLDQQEVETPQQAGGGIFSSLGNAAKNFGVGALKGAGSTVLGIGELGTKTLGRLVGADVAGTAEFAKQQRDTTLKPEGMAQGAGFLAEQVGEFFVPGGAVSKSTKALETASTLVKTAEKAPQIMKAAETVAKTASRVVPQAAADVAVSAAQTGGDTEQMKRTGQFSVIGGVAGQVASKGLKGFGNWLFQKTVPGTPAELARDIGKNVDVGDALSKTGVSLTRGSLLKKVGERINTFSTKMDDILSNVGGTANRSFDDVANDAYGLLKDREIAKTLQATPINFDDAKKVVSETIEKYRDKFSGKILTAAEQQQIKKDIGLGLGKIWDKTLGTPIRAEAFAEKKLSKALTTFLEKNVDGYEAINKELAPLLEAAKRAKAKGAYGGYLTDVIVGSMAGSTGGNIINDPVGFLQNGLTAVLLKHGVTSTLGKTLIGTISKKVGTALDTPAFYQLLRKMTTGSPQGQSVDEEKTTTEPTN